MPMELSMASPDNKAKMTDSTLTPSGHVLLYLPWKFDLLGGVDVVVDRLWKGLENRFPGIAKIGIQDWNFQGEQTDQEGRRFLHLNLPAPPSADGKLPLRYLLTLARRMPALKQLLARHEITTVNVHFPTLNVYSLALLKYFGLWRGRIILSFHGSDVAEISPNTPRWKFIADQADAITACSAALAKQVDDLRLFKQAAHVIHNGIDCERFLQNALRTNPIVSGRYILNVGNYVAHKGQNTLLEAFAQIAEKYPEINLICAGGTNNGSWLSQLRQLSTQLEIEGRVIFLEDQTQEQIASLMRNALFLAHVSEREGLPLVLIEAAACDIPIIATRVGGIPEIIPSPEYGNLIDHGDIRALRSALEDFIDAPDQAKMLAVKLKERVEAFFSLHLMLNGYVYVIIDARPS